MFTAHWGLDRPPFGVSPNPADYFPSSSHEEALARLLYLVENGRRLGFLVGAAGAGKSLVLAVSGRKLREGGCHVLRLNLTGIDGHELTWKVATGLGFLTAAAAGPVEWWRGITDRLTALRYQRMTTVVLLDDVGAESGPGIDATISRLALTDPHPEARLTLVLTGDPRQVARLGSKLHDLCELRIELEPWEPQETAAWLQETLVRCGGSAEIFAESALIRLHELAAGNPRRARQLAEVALATGAAEELRQIDSQLVESVYGGLKSEGTVDAT